MIGKALATAALGCALTAAVAAPAPAQTAQPRRDGPTMLEVMTDHLEGRLAFLKAELAITDTQAPQWNTFAAAVESSAKTMLAVRQQTAQSRDGAVLARLDRAEKILSARLEAVRQIRTALAPLYTTFSEDQRRRADQLVISPMGMLDLL